MRVRRKEQQQERARTQNRDFTRYHVIADERELPETNKRQTMLAMVTALIEHGVSPAEIEDVLGPRFRSVEGELDDFLPAFHTAYDHAVPAFKPLWAYTDHPFRQDGRTWLLSKGWGTNTEPALNALTERFPAAGVSFRRAD